MNGYEYENLCAQYLKKSGFSNVVVTKSSGDQGIDVTAYKNGKKYGIQCKYYSQSVGNKAVQEAYSGAAFYKCDIAVVMTNNTFTKSAKELSESLGVLLWEKKDEKTLKKVKIENSHRVMTTSDMVLSIFSMVEAILLIAGIIALFFAFPIGIGMIFIFLVVFFSNYLIARFCSWKSFCKRNMRLLNGTGAEEYLNKKKVSVKELTQLLNMVRSKRIEANETDKKILYKMEVAICNFRNEIVDEYYNSHPEIPINEADYIMPKK